MFFITNGITVLKCVSKRTYWRERQKVYKAENAESQNLTFTSSLLFNEFLKLLVTFEELLIVIEHFLDVTGPILLSKVSVRGMTLCFCVGVTRV